MALDELGFVEWLSQRQRTHPLVKLGIGDDMAVLDLPAREMLVSSDLLLDGVHFETDSHSLAAIGGKAIACGLSDCAAMAVRPTAAAVSVAFPHNFMPTDAETLFDGMLSVAERFDVAIVGGDTTKWAQPLAIDVTMIASPYADVAPVRRSGAKPGDRLYVTGLLGGSIRGRHLTFEPRIKEARLLAESLGKRLHAMIDISDGLALDMWRMCLASRVGARLDRGLAELVVSEDARIAARQDEADALHRALSDGEDYELLLAVDGELGECDVKVFRVGQIIDEGFFLRHADGTDQVLTPKGYVH